jgi:hypothetical protein
MTRELNVDELDTVSGGLALDSKGLADEANDNAKNARDRLNQILKVMSSLHGSGGFTR